MPKHQIFANVSKYKTAAVAAQTPRTNVSHLRAWPGLGAGLGGSDKAGEIHAN